MADRYFGVPSRGRGVARSDEPEGPSGERVSASFVLQSQGEPAPAFRQALVPRSLFIATYSAACGQWGVPGAACHKPLIRDDLLPFSTRRRRGPGWGQSSQTRNTRHILALLAPGPLVSGRFWWAARALPWTLPNSRPLPRCADSRNDLRALRERGESLDILVRSFFAPRRSSAGQRVPRTPYSRRP